LFHAGRGFWGFPALEIHLGGEAAMVISVLLLPPAGPWLRSRKLMASAISFIASFISATMITTSAVVPGGGPP
jgi:hypothetical protein